MLASIHSGRFLVCSNVYLLLFQHAPLLHECSLKKKKNHVKYLNAFPIPTKSLKGRQEITTSLDANFASPYATKLLGP